MGSNRKKKEKQKDFVKTKLRVGKTALKPANATSTEFKAKRINLSTQTKSLLSNTPSYEYIKKLSILKKTTTNLNSRKEILAEFLDHILKDPSQEHYSLPLDEVLKVMKLLLLDQSKKIRTDSRLVIEQLIKHHNNLVVVNHDSIMLFIFSAMTHLKPTIRQDSLKTLEIIIDGGERLRELTIINYWTRIWRNLMVLLNWKKENKSYTDQNDFKDFDGMRENQLKFLEHYLTLGCIPISKEPENNESIITDLNVQIHGLTNTYMLKENIGMIYRNLKLFGNIGVLKSSARDEKTGENVDVDDTMICEDLDGRVKVFVEGFYDLVKQGLVEYTKVDDKKLVSIANRLLNTLELIKKKYDTVCDE